MLAAGGLVCVASLSAEASGFASLLTRTWEQVWSRRPMLVGGCRPTRVATYLPPSEWVILARRIVTSFGVPSEVLVAQRTE